MYDDGEQQQIEHNTEQENINHFMRSINILRYRLSTNMMRHRIHSYPQKPALSDKNVTILSMSFP